MSSELDTPEAGPSSPRAAPVSPIAEVPASTKSETDDAANTDPSPQPATPAPAHRTEAIPAAPAHAPPAKDLPASTPSTSATPTTPTTRPAPDISEFDPFATPMPASRASGRDDPGQGQSQGHERAAKRDGHALEPSPMAKSTPVHTTAARHADVQSPAQSPSQPQRTGGGGGTRTGPDSPSASTSGPSEPAFNFSGFLKDLRLKSAEPVARYLKSFLSNFAKKPFTVNEQIKLIHDFLDFIAGKMALCEPWKSQSPAEFDNAMEAMEKLVMNRLYNYTFTPQLVPSQPITTDDLERDAVFSQRVRLFGWIREKHLDVPEGEASQGFVGFAQQELLKINHYKAPRDKMICILNCCKVIFGLIRHVNGADSTSADAFVPILIFVVLHANPDNMLSNVEYINRFRSASKLSGEGGYYLSSLSGAIAFIETMDASSLSNISQEEFEANVESAIQDLPPSPSSRTFRPQLPTEMSPFAPSTPGEEPARPLSLSTSFAALDNTKRFFQKTGSTVTEAVSKPLNAISKIFDGMQQDEEGSTSGASGGSDDGEQVERRWRAGGSRDREHDARLDGHGQEQAEGGSVRTPLRPANTRPFTPDSPSRRFAQLGLTPESGPPSGAGTPMRDVPMPDFSSEQIQSTLDMSQEAFAQTRRANVQTLHQMFPALDEEVVEAVLESCGDDLGVAIDRLLEM